MPRKQKVLAALIGRVHLISGEALKRDGFGETKRFFFGGEKANKHKTDVWSERERDLSRR